MFDIGWSELLLVGAVALVVIGPKDLPGALRTLGRMTGKMRRMAGEFQNQFNEAIREAEMDDIRRSVADVGQTAKDLQQSFNPIQTIRDEIKGAIDGRAPAASPPSEPAAPEPALPAPVAGDVTLPVPDLPEVPALDLASAASMAAASTSAAVEGSAADTSARVDANEDKPAKKRKPRARKTAAGSGEGEGAAPVDAAAGDLSPTAGGDTAPPAEEMAASPPARRKRKPAARKPKTQDAADGAPDAGAPEAERS